MDLSYRHFSPFYAGQGDHPRLASCMSHAFILIPMIFPRILESMLLLLLSFPLLLASQDPEIDWSAINSPENLGNGVNSRISDFIPIVTPDGQKLYFIRYNSKGSNRTSDDIYVSDYDARSDRWLAARKLSYPMNTDYSDAIKSITPDGTVALIDGSVHNARSTDPLYKPHQIGLARRTASGWAKPKLLWIDDYHHYYPRLKPYAFLSNNQQILILGMADRDDSRGKFDLYVSFLQDDGTWSRPLNLGNTINTSGMDWTAFLASDNRTLYFASDGHGGYGDLDIFVTRRLDDTWTNWSTPRNMGPVINSSGAEDYFSITASGKYAYFASGGSGYGQKDIFRIELPQVLRPEAVVLIKGTVYDQKTKQPIEAEITYEYLKDGKLAGVASSEPGSGKYQITLQKGEAYGFQAKAEGYFGVSTNIDLDTLQEYAEIERDLYLEPLDTGRVVKLNNVFFEYDETDLLPESYPELQRVVDLLDDNPTLRIELAGHTDADGSDAYNLRLSQARINSVRDYLLSKEIKANRLTAVGYGERKPVADNSTEEGKALNRRVEFKIIAK